MPGTRWVGGTAFAQHILPTITANGGQTRAGVRVAELLLDGDKAVGVTTSDGEEIRAEVVILAEQSDVIFTMLPDGKHVE